MTSVYEGTAPVSVSTEQLALYRGLHPTLQRAFVDRAVLVASMNRIDISKFVPREQHEEFVSQILNTFEEKKNSQLRDLLRNVVLTQRQMAFAGQGQNGPRQPAPIAAKEEQEAALPQEKRNELKSKIDDIAKRFNVDIPRPEQPDYDRKMAILVQEVQANFDYYGGEASQYTNARRDEISRKHEQMRESFGWSRGRRVSPGELSALRTLEQQHPQDGSFNELLTYSSKLSTLMKGIGFSQAAIDYQLLEPRSVAELFKFGVSPVIQNSLILASENHKQRLANAFSARDTEIIGVSTSPKVSFEKSLDSVPYEILMSASVSAREKSQIYQAQLDVGDLFESRMEQFSGFIQQFGVKLGELLSSGMLRQLGLAKFHRWVGDVMQSTGATHVEEQMLPIERERKWEPSQYVDVINNGTQLAIIETYSSEFQRAIQAHGRGEQVSLRLPSNFPHNRQPATPESLDSIDPINWQKVAAALPYQLLSQKLFLGTLERGLPGAGAIDVQKLVNDPRAQVLVSALESDWKVQRISPAAFERILTSGNGSMLSFFINKENAAKFNSFVNSSTFDFSPAERASIRIEDPDTIRWATESAELLQRHLPNFGRSIEQRPGFDLLAGQAEFAKFKQICPTQADLEALPRYLERVRQLCYARPTLPEAWTKILEAGRTASSALPIISDPRFVQILTPVEAPKDFVFDPLRGGLVVTPNYLPTYLRSIVNLDSAMVASQQQRAVADGNPSLYTEKILESQRVK